MSDNRKFKDPLGILVGVLMTYKAAITGEVDEVRRTALTTEVEGFTVDTCNSVDEGWETGVEPTGEKWIIVERYITQELAEAGHKRWVKSLTDNPKQELRDINYEYEEVDSEQSKEHG